MASIALGSSSICVALSSSIFDFLMELFAAFDFCLLAQWDIYLWCFEVNGMVIMFFVKVFCIAHAQS